MSARKMRALERGFVGSSGCGLVWVLFGLWSVEEEEACAGDLVIIPASE